MDPKKEALYAWAQKNSGLCTWVELIFLKNFQGVDFIFLKKISSRCIAC